MHLLTSAQTSIVCAQTSPAGATGAVGATGSCQEVMPPCPLPVPPCLGAGSERRDARDIPMAAGVAGFRIIPMAPGMAGFRISPRLLEKQDLGVSPWHPELQDSGYPHGSWNGRT